MRILSYQKKNEINAPKIIDNTLIGKEVVEDNIKKT